MSCLLERMLLVSLVIAVCPLVARAEVTFLGPTPYLSVADNPFDMSGLGTTFFLEDFEDGSFDLPPGATTSDPEVVPPSPTTDSVDADDGVIDGYGTSGYSLSPPLIGIQPSDPPRFFQILYVVFDSNVLGFSPNAFGFVCTDGVTETHSLLGLIVYDGDGTRTLSPNWNTADFMDNGHSGETAEDRFFGLRTTREIAQVEIVMSFVSDTFIDHFEIDHIQFGYFVPEPVFYPTVLGCVFVVAAVRPRGRRNERASLHGWALP